MNQQSKTIKVWKKLNKIALVQISGERGLKKIFGKHVFKNSVLDIYYDRWLNSDRQIQKKMKKRILIYDTQ